MEKKMKEEVKNVNNEVKTDEVDKAENNHYEQMAERWTYTANGYTFAVRPIMFGEEPEFLEELKASPVPSQIIEGEDTPTEKELSRWAITLFSDALNEPLRDAKTAEKQSIFKRLVAFFKTKFLRRKDHTYYDKFPAVYPMVKWIERKVTYKGKQILFYDLERKFQLNKAEIEQLFIFLYQISGF